MILSDFLVDDLDDVFGALRLFRHRQFEVIVLHVVHPDEERLPEGRAYRFVGLENDGSVDASPHEVRAIYQERFEAHVAQVRVPGAVDRLRLPAHLNGGPLPPDFE